MGLFEQLTQGRPIEKLIGAGKKAAPIAERGYVDAFRRPDVRESFARKRVATSVVVVTANPPVAVWRPRVACVVIIAIGTVSEA